jgi:uncharacterized membrane protein
MEANGRQAAQNRVDRIAMFKAELAELEREGGLTLTPEQSAGLDTHLHTVLSTLRAQYGVDATESARRVSWGMRIASLIGAAALLAAGILFLHRVWGNLTISVQLLLLTIAPIALLLGGEMACVRRLDHYYVGLFAIAAGVALILEVNALGAVLNLTDSPQVLLVWGAFALLLAYAYGLRLLLAAGLLLACAWSGALTLHLRGDHWVDFMPRAELLIPAAAVVYALPWLIRGPDGFDLVYRLCGAGLGLLSLLILSTAGDLCCGGILLNHVAAAYQLAGLLLSLGVIVHGLRQGQPPLVNLGALGFVVFLFVRLHSWWWHWMPKYLFFLLLGLIAFGLLLVFRRIRGRLSEGVSL